MTLCIEDGMMESSIVGRPHCAIFLDEYNSRIVKVGFYFLEKIEKRDMLAHILSMARRWGLILKG